MWHLVLILVAPSTADFKEVHGEYVQPFYHGEYVEQADCRTAGRELAEVQNLSNGPEFQYAYTCVKIPKE